MTLTQSGLVFAFAFESLRQASEQYFTSCQFLAQDFRQVMAR